MDMGENRHGVAVTLGTNDNKEDREQNDFYATPPAAAEWLCKLETLDKNIWECACGAGHLGKVLENHGHNVFATDLIDRGYGTGGIDFLQCTEKFDGDIITNPPYKLAQEFVEKALELVTPGHKVCMFLRVLFLEGKKRKALFEREPPKRIYISSSRLCCGKSGVFTAKENNAVAFAWFVWEKGYTGETTLKWFN